jgi:catechol 2,3-dioxygenase-like lactoylglutathione lyase family enzyme
VTIQRMDNVLLVVDDLETVKAFFLELGLDLEGEATVEGPLVGKLIGLADVRATVAMLRPPDGHGGIELDKFHTPDAIRFGPVDAPVNVLGLRRVMFAVEDIGGVVARMQRHGAELIGEMQYGDTYRLAYIRGPEGIIVGLAEELRGARKPPARKRAKPKAAVRRSKSAGRRRTS